MKATCFDGWDHKEVCIPETPMDKISLVEIMPQSTKDMYNKESSPGKALINDPENVWLTVYKFHHYDVMDGHPIYWATYLTDKDK